MQNVWNIYNNLELANDKHLDISEKKNAYVHSVLMRETESPQRSKKRHIYGTQFLKWAFRRPRIFKAGGRTSL